MPGPLASYWFKSSYSGGSGTECVECSPTREGTLVRDSKDPTGPMVTVGSVAWQSFIGQLSHRAWGH
ncbi:DUF397 domain-containing protein [Streptomyces mirabilis]|jgi:hypothetical protein|uniref:DUF397 domain-containing protein n=1 Tax=Streptomyces mirabilis TaxID=68239 RepID=A0A1I2JKK5_9ACTN|nr:DUF397 domain-containing protein [Streptomyces mirabilis]SFF54403.1 protein of unknown function [Streptomyces mirabilis]